MGPVHQANNHFNSRLEATKFNLDHGWPWCRLLNMTYGPHSNEARSSIAAITQEPCHTFLKTPLWASHGDKSRPFKMILMPTTDLSSTLSSKEMRPIVWWRNMTEMQSAQSLFHIVPNKTVGHTPCESKLEDISIEGMGIILNGPYYLYVGGHDGVLGMQYMVWCNSCDRGLRGSGFHSNIMCKA